MGQGKLFAAKLDFGPVCAVKVGINRAFPVCAIIIVAQGCNETQYIWWATGTTEQPHPACGTTVCPHPMEKFQVGGFLLQGIFVEEGIAVQRDAGQGTVIHLELQIVCKTAVGIHIQDALSQEHKADRCTGFGVGFKIRKEVGGSKCFAMLHVTHTAGNIHFVSYRFVKGAFAGFQKCCIAIFLGNIRRTGEEVGIPDHMALGTLLFPDRILVLGVGGMIFEEIKHHFFPGTTHVDKMLGQGKITFFSRSLIKLYQGKLDLLVARGVELGPLGLDKDFLNVIGIAAHEIQKFTFTGNFVVGDCRFH